jgi:hypothetical protein
MVNRATNVRWNGNYIFGSDTLIAQPQLSALVAATIAGWAVTEAHLGRTFAALIGAKHPVTLSMYAAVRSFEVQRDILLAAAREALPPRYAMVFSAALSVLLGAAKHRHQFAHWIWGSSADPGLPALFLVEPKHFWSLDAARIRFDAKHARVAKIDGVPTVTFFANRPQLSRDHIHVYRLKDLEEARHSVERAYRIANALRDLVAPNAPRRRAIHRWLCAEPQIQKALAKVKKDWPRSPPKPRAPRRKGAPE